MGSCVRVAPKHGQGPALITQFVLIVGRGCELRFCRSTREISCCERLVKFIQQLGQLIAEELMRFAEAAALAKGGVVEVFGFDAEAGGDVVADEVEPGE